MESRIPPQAVDVEQVVLGSVLTDWQAAAVVAQELKPETFYDHRHRAVAEQAIRMFREGQTIDLITMTEALRSAGHLDRIGGAYYLTELSSQAAYGIDRVTSHAKILREKEMLRRVIQVGTESVSAAYDPGADAFEIVERLQAGMASVAIGGFRETHIREAVREARDHLAEWMAGERPDRFPSGIYRLDRLTSGYPVGEVTLMAAQSGAGKTAWAVQGVKAAGLRAQKSIKKRGAVLLFSAEMTRSQIVERAAAAMSKVNLEVIASGNASEFALAQYNTALDTLETLEIHVDDEAEPSLTYIAAKCEQIKAQYGLDFVVIDYDEKVGAEGKTEELRVSAIAQGLKSIAKRIGVAMLTLSQYSRGGETNYGLPSDAHLRYSGKKKQEAAQILHWYWPGYFVANGVGEEIFGKMYDSHQHGRGWIIVTKNRFGGNGRVELEFEETTTRFIDHADPEEFAPNVKRAPIPESERIPLEDAPF